MLTAGDIVGGRYEIIDVLQKNQCVIYYLARHKELDTSYCVHQYDLEKITESNSDFRNHCVEHDKLYEHFAARLLSELKEYASLSHPHLQGVIDLFRKEGYVYCVTPYYGVVTLDEAECFVVPMSLDKTQEVIRPMADALRYLHNHQFCHLTFCPKDIILAENKKLYLLTPSLILQLPGIGIQPVHHKMEGYAAPERYTRAGHVCAEMDTFSLTALLYYLLTGVRPPVSTGLSEDNPLPGNKRFTPSLYSFLAKGMNPDPQKRFLSVKEWLAAYERILKELPLPKSEKKVYPSLPSGDGMPKKSTKFVYKSPTSRPHRGARKPKKEFVPQGARPRPVVKPEKLSFGWVLFALGAVVAIALVISVVFTKNTLNDPEEHEYHETSHPSMMLYDSKKIIPRKSHRKEVEKIRRIEPEKVILMPKDSTDSAIRKISDELELKEVTSKDVKK